MTSSIRTILSCACLLGALYAMPPGGQAKTIREYPAVTNLADGDAFIVEAATGTTNYSVTAGTLFSLARRGMFTNIIVVPPPTGVAAIDSTNIQYCVDLATNNGVTPFGGQTEIYLQAGQYVIDRTIVLKASGITLRGAGIDRTRIVQTSATANAFDAHTLAGFNESSTNAIWYVTFKDFTLYKTIDTTSRTAGFGFVTAVSSSQKLSRALFENIKIYGFFYGLRVEHGVGLTCINVHAYNNNHGFWLEKADSAVFINCFAGDGLNNSSYTNNFGTNTSTAWTYKPSSYAEGFSLTIIGGESRRCNTVVDAQGGNVSIEGMNIEVMPNGPVFKFSSGVKSVDIRGCRVQRLSTNTAPIVELASGVGPRTRIHALDRGADLSGAPVISLGGAGDYVNYTGPAITITNRGNSTSWTTTRPVEAVAAGSNVTITTNGGLLTISAATSGEVTNLTAFRENGTNVLYFVPWMLLNADNTTQGATAYQYGAYRAHVSPYLKSGWKGIASVWHTNVNFTNTSRPLVIPVFRPSMNATNFRFTGYWCATNSTTFRAYGLISALRPDGSVVDAWNGVNTDWTYSSTTTNVMAHTVTVSLPPGTNLWVQGYYGPVSGAGVTAQRHQRQVVGNRGFEGQAVLVPVFSEKSHALAETAYRPRRCERSAAHADAAPLERLQAEQDLRQLAAAGAHQTEKAEDLASVQLKRDVVHYAETC